MTTASSASQSTLVAPGESTTSSSGPTPTLDACSTAIESREQWANLARPRGTRSYSQRVDCPREENAVTVGERICIAGVALACTAGSLAAGSAAEADPHTTHAAAAGFSKVDASCRVWNVTTGSDVSADLQAVLDTASAGDVVEIGGVCTGGFMIDTSVTLRKRATRSVAVLDADRQSEVLTATGLPETPITVRLRGLTLREGHHSTEPSNGGGIYARDANLVLRDTVVRDSRGEGDGGGIWASGGYVTLVNSDLRHNSIFPGHGGGIWTNRPLTVRGDSHIEGNRAAAGGGIFALGPVRLSGAAFVGGNEALGGGGIWNERGRTVLNDRAHVAGNVATWGGGGIRALLGDVFLNDHASVRGNVTTAEGQSGEGAGVYCEVGCSVFLNDHSSIVSNQSSTRGGALYVQPSGRGGLVRMTGHARISGNRATLGGGLYMHRGAAMTMRDRTRISHNTAAHAGGGVYGECWRNLAAHARIGRNAVLDFNHPDNITRKGAEHPRAWSPSTRGSPMLAGEPAVSRFRSCHRHRRETTT